MRLLLTTDTIGGVWTFTREITQHLLMQGHAVALVSFGRCPSKVQRAWSETITAQYGDDFVFRASDTPLEWMQENAAAYSTGARLLLKTAREFRADLLHSSQFCWGVLPCDLPRVITAHSDVLSWAAASVPHDLPESEWLACYRELVQRGLDSADAVAAPTAWMRRALIANFNVSCKFTVIHNGRTISVPTPAPQRKLQAVSVGRLWDESKGTRILQTIESPLPILLAGEERFSNASASIGSLQTLGILDESALVDLFYSSSVYIATSIYEPFGLAPLEAALCGCAVVARDISSLREVWQDAALFFRSPQELETALRELVNYPSLLRTMQRKSLARARGFTAGDMADKYFALYESLLTSGHTSTSSHLEPVAHVA